MLRTSPVLLPSPRPPAGELCWVTKSPVPAAAQHPQLVSHYCKFVANTKEFITIAVTLFLTQYFFCFPIFISYSQGFCTPLWGYKQVSLLKFSSNVLFFTKYQEWNFNTSCVCSLGFTHIQLGVPFRPILSQSVKTPQHVASWLCLAVNVGGRVGSPPSGGRWEMGQSFYSIF